MIMGEYLMRRTSVAVFFIFFFLCVVTRNIYSASRDSTVFIRVGIVRNASSVVINGKTITPGSISGSKLFEGSEKKYVKVNDRPYRGDIEVRKNGKHKLTVINILDIEKYLYGVIKMEISPRWPEDAVKAQIVAARTFALKNRDKHKDEGFDICSTVHCQVYGGVNAEDKVSNKYVDETRGEVMTYRGELINSSFHGICGGMTEEPKNVWNGGKTVPYLRSVRCNFCKDAPGFKWEVKVPLYKIREKLQSAGIEVGKISSLMILRKTISGRAAKIRVTGANGTETIDATKLRSLLGTNVIKSTMFTLQKKHNNIVFKGQGWGHGVGMCQEGARGMAKKGYSYKQILEYYYRGVMIKKWRGK